MDLHPVCSPSIFFRFKAFGALKQIWNRQKANPFRRNGFRCCILYIQRKHPPRINTNPDDFFIRLPHATIPICAPGLNPSIFPKKQASGFQKPLDFFITGGMIYVSIISFLNILHTACLPSPRSSFFAFAAAEHRLVIHFTTRTVYTIISLTANRTKFHQNRT